MTINNQIEALSIKNTMVKPVNMTEFNNPFLLLSSTKALNELVVNTNPSSRAKVANIEPTKSKFQQNPLGVPIDVYTNDSATGAKVSRKKLKADAISKLSKQTASSAISSALSNVGKKAKAKKEQQASLKAAVKKGSMKVLKTDAISKLSKQTASSALSSALSNVARQKKELQSMKANDINIRKPGRPDQGVTRKKKEVAAAKAAAKAAEQQAKQKAQEAKQALQSAAKPASQSKKKRKKTTKKDPHKGL